MDELKPCPFCGSKARIVWDFDNKTVIANCINRECSAAVCVNYGRKIRIPFYVIRLKDIVKEHFAKWEADDVAYDACFEIWNNRSEVQSNV